MPETVHFTRFRASAYHERAEGFEPSARGFGGNVEFSLTLRLCPDFGDLLPTALLMMEELMLF